MSDPVELAAEAMCEVRYKCSLDKINPAWRIELRAMARAALSATRGDEGEREIGWHREGWDVEVEIPPPNTGEPTYWAYNRESEMSTEGLLRDVVLAGLAALDRPPSAPREGEAT